MTILPSFSGSFPLTRSVALLIALLLLSAGPVHGQAPCAPPPSMKAQLHDKPSAAALTDLGVWFAGQKQYACAANAFATSLQMEPNQKDIAHVAFMFGVSLYFSGDTEEAIAALRQAEQLGFRDLKLNIVLATALDASHSTKNAAEEWRAALALDPESATALDGLSNDLLLESDFNGVIALLENPRLLGERTPQQSLNLAEAYAGTARLDAAASVLRDALNTSPDSLPLANRLADLLVQLGRRDEAVTVLDLALAQHPDDSDTAVHYLETLMAARPEKAPEAAHRLLLVFPQNSKLLYLSGILDMKAGNLEPARAHLEQSLALQPDDALSHEALGLVLAQLNQMTGAKEHLQRAIALGDNGPEVKESLKRVLQALAAGK
jgi:Flp pilus assembly protein TadD